MSICSFYIIHVGPSRFIGHTHDFRGKMYDHYDRAYLTNNSNVSPVQYAMRNYSTPSTIYGEEIARYSRCSRDELILLEHMYIHRHGADLNSFGRCCFVDYKYGRYLENRMILDDVDLEVVNLQELYDDTTFECIMDDDFPIA